MKRVVLFVLTNIAVLVVLSVVLSVLGFNQPGSGMGTWIIIAALMGMGGSFVSLLISKSMAKRSTGARVIEQPRTESEAWLVETVRRQAQQAGIGMPEVAVYDSPAPNAFATGANRDSALVAVSTGLLQHMQADEVEAVLGHEVTHVANGDMVTLALIQGVVNTFVLVFARVIGMAMAGRQSGGSSMGYYAGYMIGQVVLGFLATLIVMWFSRQREFRADAGGASLAGRSKMIAALQRLGQAGRPSQLPEHLDAFGINGGLRSGLAKLFMSHPPLEERIAALRAGAPQ